MRINDLAVADWEYCNNNNVHKDIQKLKFPLKSLVLREKGHIFSLEINEINDNHIILNRYENVIDDSRHIIKDRTEFEWIYKYKK